MFKFGKVVGVVSSSLSVAGGWGEVAGFKDWANSFFFAGGVAGDLGLGRVRGFDGLMGGAEAETAAGAALDRGMADLFEVGAAFPERCKLGILGMEQVTESPVGAPEDLEKMKKSRGLAKRATFARADFTRREVWV